MIALTCAEPHRDVFGRHICVFVPCYNEENQLGDMLRELLRATAAFSALEIVVIDDGSTDASAAIAESLGVRVVRRSHAGYARTYAAGLEEGWRSGAEIVVSLDADAQYDPSSLADVIAPIVAGAADFVLSERGQPFFQRLPPFRRGLHRLGNLVVRRVTHLPIQDAATGYRAYTATAARALKLRSTFCCSLEILVLASAWGMRFASVQCSTRLTVRPSRIFRFAIVYCLRQAAELLRALARAHAEPTLARSSNLLR